MYTFDMVYYMSIISLNRIKNHRRILRHDKTVAQLCRMRHGATWPTCWTETHRQWSHVLNMTDGQGYHNFYVLESQQNWLIADLDFQYEFRFFF